MKIKKIRMIAVLAISVVICMAAVFTSSATDFDKDIKPGDSFSGEIKVDSQEDVYRVELPGSGRLSISVTANMDHLRCYIRDSNDDQVMFTYVDAGTESFDIDLNKGVYYLTFAYFTGLGPYSVNTSFLSADKTYETDNDSINKIRTGAPIPFDSKINGFIAQNKEDDCYKLELPESGRLSLSVHSDAERVAFRIYDSNDSSLDLLNFDKGDESIDFDLTAGVYYLHFSRSLGSGYGMFNFVSHFEGAGETYTYDNNSINLVRNQTAVPLCKTVTGQIAFNDESDYYKLYVPKKGKYSFTINSKLSMVDFSLYDSRDSYVSRFTHYIGKKTYSYTLEKGTYYLGTDKRYSEGCTGTYTLVMRPGSVKLKSVKPAKKAFKATWKKGKGSGYQLQYSTSSKFTKNVKTVTIKKSATTSKKIKKLKKGKKYYVRIRSYVKYEGKKYCSAWSKAMTVKVK